MAETTGISWCEHTWNPWIGCTRISAACDNCYAETLVRRWGGDFALRRRTSAENWKLPHRWNRKAEAAGIRARVFCASLADFFDNQADDEWRRDAWATIEATPWLDWMLLTKRPQNIRKMLPESWGWKGWPNVWLGTTAETRLAAAQRLPHVLAVPAALHFVSVEPMLERMTLTDIQTTQHLRLNALTGFYNPTSDLGLRGYAEELAKVPEPCGQKLGLVIIGGESGPRSRPMHMGWVEELVRQARSAGTAVHVKQVGSNRVGTEWPAEVTGKGDDPAEWPVHLQVQQRPAPGHNFRA